MLLLWASGARANVSVTAASGGANVSADKALNGAVPAFTTLGNIVIAEPVNPFKADFATGTNKTLILSAPVGWRFNAGVGSVSFASGNNITAASISVATSNLTVTLTVSGSNAIDSLTLSGLQMQAVEGGTLPVAGSIVRSSGNPGTASIAGITNDVTSFGPLSQAIGARRLYVVLPGQSFIDDSAVASSGITGTPDVQTAGTSFALAKLVAADRQFNIDTAFTGAKTISYGGPGGSPSYTTGVSFSAGQSTNTLATTLRKAETTTLTATEGTAPGVASSSFTVVPAGFSKVQLLVPGETAAPGTTNGKAGTAVAQTAGASFSITINAVDGNWNLITNVIDTVQLTSSDTNSTLPPDAALSGGSQTFSLTLRTTPSAAVTASDATDPSKTAATNAAVPVSAAAAVRLTIQTQPPSTVTAGATFAPAPVIRVEDQFGNLRTSDNSTVVRATRNAGTGSMVGTTNVTVSGGVASFSNLSYRIAETITVDFTSGSLTGATSGTVTVNPAVASKLLIQTQPSATASAGVPFASQPGVAIADTFGNVITTNNSTVITAAVTGGSAPLQGTVNAAAANGVAAFTNLSYNLVDTIAMRFTAGGLMAANSGNIAVGAGPVAQLVFTAQPGGPKSSAGSPLFQQPTLRTQDQYGNNSTNGLPATLPVTMTLTSGKGPLVGTTSMNIGAAGGNGTVSFTNLQINAGGTNKQMTASATGLSNAVSGIFVVGGVDPAEGGTNISSATAGGSFTTLTGPSYYESVVADVGLGTVVLNAPAGFEFDTGGVAPTVFIKRIGGGGPDAKNVNDVPDATSVPVTSVTSNQITFTVISESYGGANCVLTWQNIRVRPMVASPLVSGVITKTGTSVMAAVTDGVTSFGQLIEIGTPARLTIQTQPSTTATVGVPFARQPSVRIEDVAGNLITSDNSSVVTAARNAGVGTLQGALTATAVNGVATFTNLSHDTASTITIDFTSGGFSPATSDSIIVSLPGGQTNAVLSGSVLANGHLLVAFGGVPGLTYSVQATTNFVTWTNIGTATENPAGVFTLEDADVPTFPHRFYRAVYYP